MLNLRINAEYIGSQFRFLAKQPTKGRITRATAVENTDITYVWHRLGFFTSWFPSGYLVVLCFDLPPSLKQQISTSLVDSTSQLQLGDPFVLHALLIEEIVVLYDSALWSCRNLIRHLEQVWIVALRVIRPVLNIPRIALHQTTHGQTIQQCMRLQDM
jgi:hypothetical protein